MGAQRNLPAPAPEGPHLPSYQVNDLVTTYEFGRFLEAQRNHFSTDLRDWHSTRRSVSFRR